MKHLHDRALTLDVAPPTKTHGRDAMKSRLLMLATLGLFAAAPLQAAAPVFLAEMPEAGRVVKDMQGNGERDNAARVHSTLYIMAGMVEGLAHGTRKSSQEAAALAAEYRTTAERLYETEKAGYPSDCQNDNCDRYKLARCAYEYTMSAELRREILSRYFSPGWQQQYGPVLARNAGTLWRDALDLPQDQRSAVDFSGNADCTDTSIVGRWWEASTAALGLGDIRQQTVLDQLPENERSVAYKAYAGLLLLTLFGFARELRPFRLSPDDPFRLHAGYSHYILHTATGMVLSPTKDIEKEITVHGDGRGRVHSTSHTVIHDQFFIRNAQSHETEVKLRNVDLALRAGHDFSAVWAIKRGKKFGNYFLLRNHTTNRADFLDHALKEMLTPHRWPALMLTLLILMTALVYSPAARDLEGGGGWMLARLGLAILVGYAVFRALLARWRQRQVRKEIKSRVIPILDQRAMEDRVTRAVSAQGAATQGP